MARRTDRLEIEVEAIKAKGAKAIALALDVSDAAAIGPAFDAAQAALGPMSILVNNAGVGGAGLALEMPAEVFDATFAVNVRAVFIGAREAARRMIDSGVAAAGNARIVNIASITAFQSAPGLTAYAATKAAAVSLTKGLAREWSRPLIAVNAICPGYIETEINADWFKTEAGAKHIRSFPRRRLIDAEALDASLLMLSGPAAKFITGTAITIDDGQLL
jgi:NAD(P)-dependent dehydrogenase (short-subunit alcohol dehydrogenase family)